MEGGLSMFMDAYEGSSGMLSVLFPVSSFFTEMKKPF